MGFPREIEVPWGDVNTGGWGTGASAVAAEVVALHVCVGWILIHGTVSRILRTNASKVWRHGGK